MFPSFVPQSLLPLTKTVDWHAFCLAFPWFLVAFPYVHARQNGFSACNNFFGILPCSTIVFSFLEDRWFSLRCHFNIRLLMSWPWSPSSSVSSISVLDQNWMVWWVCTPHHSHCLFVGVSWYQLHFPFLLCCSWLVQIYFICYTMVYSLYPCEPKA